MGANLESNQKTFHEPLVSVVVNFLNPGEFIREAIESVFAQTYGAWELLLVDDGSTDVSTEIARDFEKSHPDRVRYLEHPGHVNRGASASRNLGADLAKGTYLAFLDSDDIWLPMKLERQVAILEKEPEAVMVYGPAKWWYGWTGRSKDGLRDFQQGMGLEPNTLVPTGKLLTLFLGNENVVQSMSGPMYRREAFIRIGRSEEDCRSIYDDQIVYAKLNLAAPVWASDECWYWYRQHPYQRNQEPHIGRHLAIRKTYLSWLEGYLSRNGISDPEVWQALRREQRPFRSPFWYGIEYLRHYLGGIKKGIQKELLLALKARGR